MEKKAAKRRLAALLSADAVGYSRLMSEDEAATVKTLSAYRDAIGGLVLQHDGRVVDFVGDNLLAEFPSAADAVACAVAVQRDIESRNSSLPYGRRMEFRIGIHLGDVMVDGKRIYGDGVNIAARLEPLAEPGGIAISATVHEQVRNRLPIAWEDLGQRTLKNIAEPVRVLRTRAVGARSDDPASLTVPGFAGRPAIAVLAFDNLSGDPEQEYFADGIAEDLITGLSAFRVFPVIARNSSFTYKGKPVDVKQVSRELGVRYVVEGSVRKVGDRVRVSAQLIDATTGHHVWAERYDRKLEDIFALQDEIVATIMGSLEPALARAEEHRAARKAPETYDAWDCVQRGFWHLAQFRKEDVRKAEAWMRRACALDPSFAPAFSGLASTYGGALIFQTVDDPADALREALQAAERAIALSRDDPTAYFVLGIVHSFMGQQERAIAALERALDLNPSFASAYSIMAFALTCMGRPDEALAMAEKALRLAPRDAVNTPAVLFTIAAAHFVAGRYAEAVDAAAKSRQMNPTYPPSLRILAASLGHLGRVEEARSVLDEMYELVPDFTVETLRFYLPPAIVDRYVEGWRKAGWKG